MRTCQLVFSTLTGAGGKKWLSIWLGTPAAVKDLTVLLGMPAGMGV